MIRADSGRDVSAPARQWLTAVRVEREVLALRPDYQGLVVVAEQLHPGESDAVSDRLLAAAEVAAQQRLAGRLPAGPDEVASWRDAYRAFGAKPQRTRPSVEALLRRLDGGLPRINRLTDAYNAVSMSHLVPVGGEDLDAYRSPARLFRATGGEDFDTVSEGVPVLERPEPGEVVWGDAGGVTCRRWNWRQCTRTAITSQTTRAVFILDGLAALGSERLLAAGDQLMANLIELSPSCRLATRLLGPADADSSSRGRES